MKKYTITSILISLALSSLLFSCSEKKEDNNQQTKDTDEVVKKQALIDLEYASFSQKTIRIDSLDTDQVIQQLFESQHYEPNKTLVIKSHTLKNQKGTISEEPLDITYDAIAALKEKLAGISAVPKDSTLVYAEGNDFYRKRMEVTFAAGKLSQLKIQNGWLNERSGDWYDYIIDRDYHIKSQGDSPFLAVNGVDVLKKAKKNVFDYYAIFRASGQYDFDNSTFVINIIDMPNGFISLLDEGTGGGDAKMQIVLFKTLDGKDILAVNYNFADVHTYVTTEHVFLNFYTFEDAQLKELVDIFPKIDESVFFESDFDTEGISGGYFELPQKGLSITYHLNPGLFHFCENSLEAYAQQTSEENYQMYEELCEKYKKAKTRTMEIPFNKSSGKFVLKHN